MSEPVALVTGSSRGIGRAIAVALAERGYDVVVNFLRDAESASQTTERIRALGRKALAVQADVRDPVAVERMLAEVRKEFGRLDVLVCNVGEFHVVDVLEETPSGWRSMFASNLDAAFYCSTQAVPLLREMEGKIVFIALAPAERLAAAVNTTAYTIAKVGVLILMRTLARRLAKDGIRVNAVSPGMIDTSSQPPQALEEMRKGIPLGRVGTPADIAGAVCYLVSDQAAYVTGANMVVAGGWML